ncbi:aminomethyltransferase family protein [soil metagenome]
MSFESLQEALGQWSGPAELLRNAPSPAVPFNGVAEYSNWQSEQRAWRESVALLDQSHHMNDLFISGPDALRLLSDFGVNTFEGFAVDKAKHYVTVNQDGFYIGDNILFYLDEDRFDLVGQPCGIDWIQFNAEQGDYDVEIERDPTTVYRGGRPPKFFRYELQGPLALPLVEVLVGGPPPTIKFFNMGHMTIAGIGVRALRHGMAGQPGFEFFGPWDDGEAVLEAILEAGEAFDLTRVGTKAYSTANLESGWMPALVPAIFTGDAMAPFREWLPSSGVGSLGGSFYSEDIADYYLTPFELGYRKIVSFDHDFMGRDALSQLAGEAQRERVTLIWDGDHVEKCLGTILRDDDLPAKYIDLPKARYATHQYDMATVNDDLAGFSTDCGYLANERRFVSLATVDAALSQPGTEVTVVWGEQPNSRKPLVEPHRQVEIPAIVAPAPLPTFARTGYRTD